MLFVYYKPINFFYRTVLKPFSSLLPRKLKIPVYGSYNIKLDEQTTIKFATNPTSHLGKLLYWDGVTGFEYAEVRIFIDLAKTSNVVFDIGANTGYYSMVAAALNKNSKVYGFEPMPDANYYYHLNKELNNFANITIEDYALSNVSADLEFASVFNPKFKEIKYQLAGDGSLDLRDKDSGRVKIIHVKSITLDAYVERKNIKSIDLIKIDTEASEHLVFGGSNNVLKKFRPIIQCEVLHNRIENELEAIFYVNNYSYFRVTPKGLVREQTLKSTSEDKADYYFVPTEKTDLVKKFIII